MGNNYIYPSFPGLVANPQNELFINQIPRISSIPNNLSMNSFYTGQKLLQNNFGNERSNLFGDIENINNLDPTNVSFFQMPIQNQISFNPLPNTLVSGKILANNIPNFMINNNTNINTNSNININKNINNIINLDNKNIINNNINNNNINNNININTNPNIKNENNSININTNPNIKIENNNTPLTNNNNTKSNEISIKKDLNNKIKFTLINTNNNNNLNKPTEKSKNISSVEKINLPPTQNRQIPLFNIKESSLSDKDKDNELKNQLISKKRNRFIKNNKLVFVQYDKDNENKEEKNDKNEKKPEENEDNKIGESLDSEKVSEFIQKNTKPRGSRYRGVSKNGSQWQVLIMVKKKKRYLGSFSNEEEAARAYDKVALQHHGIKAKTNYDYTKEEVEEIIAGPHLLKLE